MRKLLVLIGGLLLASIGYSQEVVKDNLDEIINKYPKKVQKSIKSYNGYSIVEIHEVNVRDLPQHFTFDVYSGNSNMFTIVSTNEKVKLKLELWGYAENFAGKKSKELTELRKPRGYVAYDHRATTYYTYKYAKGKHQITAKALNTNGEKRGKVYFVYYYKSPDNETNDASKNKAIDASVTSN